MEIFLKKKLIMNRFPVIFLIFVCFTLFVNESHSAGEAEKIKDVDFSFEGPFGTFDRNQLQRGLQVYTEVCAGCHGMKQVAFRTLGDPGGPELEPKQVKAYAAQYEYMMLNLTTLEMENRQINFLYQVLKTLLI